MMVTVFTPTYNRKHILPQLYKSLQNQTCKLVEWLIVDDGSIDGTEEMVNNWINTEDQFPIRYYKVRNGGKMRAINYGVSLAKGEFFCGIDSDDCFYNDAIFAILQAFEGIRSLDNMIGVSFSKAFKDRSPLNQTTMIDEYVDCRNYERNYYGLNGDMIQVFYTNMMRKYVIPVWEDEKFTPEAVFIDTMALDGYKLRYFKKIVYFGDYLDDGLSSGSWRLLRDNPMGYAMMYNVKMRIHDNLKLKLNDVLQFVCCCCVKGEFHYMFKSNSLLWTLLLFIPGCILALRRKIQFKKYC